MVQIQRCWQKPNGMSCMQAYWQTAQWDGQWMWLTPGTFLHKCYAGLKRKWHSGALIALREDWLSCQGHILRVRVLEWWLTRLTCLNVHYNHSTFCWSCWWVWHPQLKDFDCLTVIGCDNWLSTFFIKSCRERRSLNMISFESAMGLIRSTLNLGVSLAEVCIYLM